MSCYTSPISWWLLFRRSLGVSNKPSELCQKELSGDYKAAGNKNFNAPPKLWLVNLPPPQRTHLRNKAWLRAYEPLVSLNKALINLQGNHLRRKGWSSNPTFLARAMLNSRGCMFSYHLRFLNWQTAQHLVCRDSRKHNDIAPLVPLETPIKHPNHSIWILKEGLLL